MCCPRPAVQRCLLVRREYVGRVDEELVEGWVGGECGGEVGDVVDDGVVLFEEDGPVCEGGGDERTWRDVEKEDGGSVIDADIY